MLKRSRFIILIMAILAVFSAVNVGFCEQQGDFKLTILHTNDVHGHLFPLDYEMEGKIYENKGGAARRAALIRRIKAESSDQVLVLDAGDIFTRGPIADLMGVPDIAVMNAVPYDLMTIGNNEFKGAEGEMGLQVLRNIIKQAQFPIICANATEKATGESLVPPYKIFTVNGLKIGIFGLTPPRVAGYEQAKSLNIEDPIDTAKKVVAELEKQTDFIIALSHLGYPLDVQLAYVVDGIDVIIGGDSHTWLFQPTLVSHSNMKIANWWVGGTIICQDGEWGTRVGKLDLTLRKAAPGEYSVADYNEKLVDVDKSIAPAADIEKIISNYSAPYMKKIGYLKKSVGKSQAPAWVAELMRRAVGAQVGIEPFQSMENGLKAGNVTDLDVRAMFPFINKVVRVCVSGRQLKNVIAEKDCGLAGAFYKDNILFVGKKMVSGDKYYTIAIEDYYASTSPFLVDTRAVPSGLTTMEIVRKHLR